MSSRKIYYSIIVITLQFNTLNPSIFTVRLKTLNSAFLSCVCLSVNLHLPPRHSSSGLSVGRSVFSVRYELNIYVILAFRGLKCGFTKYR